ncbi:MAG TPA: hypothetical protein VK835_00575 [Bacteroidia bacterium]|jgi:hypothetical protein|nr:hypothetical protein [Bacteroidia bacterium]
MSYALILENWLEYDTKKKLAKQNPQNFLCTEAWERIYLTQKIKQHFPAVTDTEIATAIRECCVALTAPHPRNSFVRFVCLKLNIGIFSE